VLYLLGGVLFIIFLFFIGRIRVGNNEKECPRCSKTIPSFHFTCNHCGYKFPEGYNINSNDNSDHNDCNCCDGDGD
jgi:predicted amidophosphoribosyltransferase